MYWKTCSYLFQIGSVNYTNAHTVAIDDPAFNFSTKFKQRVNFDESSVHIPVEIYEGSEWTLL